MSFQVSVGVAVFAVYHFMLFCRPNTENNLLFLNAKTNSNLPKNCLCTSVRFGCGKIVGFRQLEFEFRLELH